MWLSASRTNLSANLLKFKLSAVKICSFDNIPWNPIALKLKLSQYDFSHGVYILSPDPILKMTTTSTILYMSYLHVSLWHLTSSMYVE